MTENELLFAKKAIAKIAEMGGSHTKMALDYLKLFSCKEQPLTLAQTFDILHEIDEFWKNYPTEIWQKAVNKLLADKVSGCLKTPLTNHDLIVDLMDEMAGFADDDIADHPRPKSPDPPPTPYTKPTEQQKAHAANYVQNMMSAINKSHFYGKQKP